MEKIVAAVRLGLWLFFRRLFSRCGLRRGSAFALIAGHAFLKTANTFAESAHQFGEFAPAKKKQHEDRYNQPVHWKFHKSLLPLTTLTRPLKAGTSEKPMKLKYNT